MQIEGPPEFYKRLKAVSCFKTLKLSTEGEPVRSAFPKKSALWPICNYLMEAMNSYFVN